MFFIKVLSKSDYSDIIINVSNIVKVVPSLHADSVILTLSSGEVLTISGSFEYFLELLTTNTQQTQAQTPTTEIKDLDKYPAELPRLPTGLVDKRTTAYKEWVAENPAE